MSKELCKWEKTKYKKKFDKLVQIVEEPQYLCIKCGRAANDSDYLCKSEKIKK